MNHSDIWPIHGSPPISCGRCMVIWHGYSRPMTGSTPLPVFQGSVQTRIIERPSNHKRIHMHVLFWWVSTNICANIFWDLWVVNGVYTSCNPSVPLSWSTFWHDVRWNTFLTHIFRTWVLIENKVHQNFNSWSSFCFLSPDKMTILDHLGYEFTCSDSIFCVYST